MHALNHVSIVSVLAEYRCNVKGEPRNKIEIIIITRCNVEH